MHTEDDTFKALRRTPFEEVVKIMTNMNKRFQSIEEKISVLEENGWNVDDYENLLDQRKMP